MNWNIVARDHTFSLESTTRRKIVCTHELSEFPIERIEYLEFKDGYYRFYAIFKQNDTAVARLYTHMPASLQGLCDVDSNVVLIEASDPQIIGLFLRCMIPIQPSMHELIQSLGSLLTITFDENYKVPSWVARGCFNKPLAAPKQFSRQVAFTNTEATHNIVAITLASDDAGLLALFIKCKSYAAQQEIIEALAVVGMKEPIFTFADTQRFRMFTLSTSDRQAIGLFLSVLKGKQENIDLVIKAIAQSLGVEFNPTYRLPAWVIQGSFNSINVWNRDIPRSVTFINTDSECGISEIKVMQTRDTRENLYMVDVSTKDSRTLLEVYTRLTREGFHNRCFLTQHVIQFTGYSKELLILFLRAAMQEREGTNVVIDHINTTLQTNLDIPGRSLGLVQKLNAKWRVEKNLVFSKIVTYLPLIEQCRMNLVTKVKDPIEAPKTTSSARNQLRASIA